MVTVTPTMQDVGEGLLRQHDKRKVENRKILLKILSNIRFLACQGLAMRRDGNEADSNFLHLLKLRGEEDLRIDEWLA